MVDVTSQVMGTNASAPVPGAATDPATGTVSATALQPGATGAAIGATGAAALGSTGATGPTGSTGAVSLVAELAADENDIADLKAKVNELVVAQNANATNATAKPSVDYGARIDRLCLKVFGDPNAV